MMNSSLEVEKVYLQCNTCGKKENIEVQKSLAKFNKTGALCLPLSDFCPHVKFIYLDHQFKIRGRFTPDYSILSSSFNTFSDDTSDIKIQCPKCKIKKIIPLIIHLPR